MMADNLLDEWLERLEFQCDEAEKATKDREETDRIMMLTSTAPPSLWRARIVAIRRLQQSPDMLALLEEAQVLLDPIHDHGLTVEWMRLRRAFLAKFETKREG